nr:23S rRNA (guanosine(2251)-2'-O)-methyltransferase RlmB [Chloroflexota bacterium]
ADDRAPEDARRGGPPRSTALPSPEALGSDEELVAGRRPVEEAFVARRPAIRLLVVPQRRAALEKIVLHATSLRIPIVEVEGGSLTALAGFDGHQGVALVVEPRQFASLDDVLARARERGEPPFILVLDSLEDPHNVGTLLRSAEAAGVHGVLFPTHRQAPLSPSAVKASAGAIEHLLLCPVDDLAGALSDLHTRGVRIAGAEGDAPMTARQSDLRGPLAIVVGSEGQGLGPAVRRRADLLMRIPMKGAVGSLNAAVAGSILLFEALAQRDPNATPRVQAELPDAPAPGPAAEGAPPADAGNEGDAGDAPVSTPAKRRAGKAITMAADAQPTAETTVGTGPEAAVAPKPRRRKVASADPDPAEPADPADAADSKPAPSAGGQAVPAEPDQPKRRVRKGLSTEAADPADETTPSPGPDLLPTDGAKKRPRKASTLE